MVLYSEHAAEFLLIGTVHFYGTECRCTQEGQDTSRIQGSAGHRCGLQSVGFRCRTHLWERVHASVCKK